MVKIGDKVSFNGRDAYVTAVNADNSISLIQDGNTYTNVTNFGESLSTSDINKDLSSKTTSSVAAAENSKGNSVSDMSNAAPGSQRNTNQPDIADLDDNSIPAPGTGDTAAGLASDGRGKQKIQGEITDRTSEMAPGQTTGESTTAIGATGIAARAKAAGIPKEIRDKMDKPVYVRRLHGTEEILVQANRATLSVIDRNGRRLEVGAVVNLPVRIIGLNSAQEVEVVYPPFIQQVEPVPTNEAGQLKNPDGSNYSGSLYKLNDSNVIVNVNTNEPPNMDEMPKQQTLTVEAVKLERT